MRIFLFILLGFVFGMGSAFAQDETSFDASTLGDDGDVIAFVGKKVFVRDDESWPPEQNLSSDEDIIYMDGRYQARYQIETLVSGDYEGETIDFHAYDHYGIPRFSKSENVLIFVHDGRNNRWHSKYNFYEVHRTSDGDWAACGNAYVQNDPEEKEKEPLEVIPFLDPVEVNIPSLMSMVDDELEPDEVITDSERAEWQAELDVENAEKEGLYQAPIWVRDGDKATCRLGTRISNLYKFQNETRFLPDKRDDMCRARHSLELDGLGDDYKAKRTLIDDCTSLLKIQNLP